MSPLAHALRIASTVACAIVIAAFAFWATDEGQAGTQDQVAKLAESDGPTGVTTAPVPGAPAAAPAGEEDHDGVRGVVEDVNAKLVAPFDGIAQGGDAWAAHGVPALLALLVYGLLARTLIPYVVTERTAR